MAELCQKLHGVWEQSLLPEPLLCRAAQWHDAGKAHAEFQKMLRSAQDVPEANGQIWAKAPKSKKDKPDKYQWPPDRKGFRHELVSALMALQSNEEFLLAYLVACHHGKVRMNIQPRPNEIKPPGKKLYALGVHEGDYVPGVNLGDVTIPALRLSLECMQLGADSWTERAFALLEEYGPFKLAFLEMLVRLADWRASTPASTME
jgi:CRISPR-associated endonuclease/helicase Cas3